MQKYEAPELKEVAMISGENIAEQPESYIPETETPFGT